MKKTCFIITCVIMIGCRNNSRIDASIQEYNEKTESNIDETYTNKESLNTVIDFLNWYKNNYETVNQFNLVKNKGVNYDSTKFYSVNFEESEKYLKKLKSSGFISDNYINKWRKYFKEHDEYLKKNPQNDGPPYGFDYDFVLLTQEIDKTIESNVKLKLLDIKESNESSIVKIDIMMRLSFSLSKCNGKWLIDNIENMVIE